MGFFVSCKGNILFIVKKVRFKNFRSYGNQFTEVDLIRNNTTVITARNGSGKTSILHAITFGLFGKVSGINKNTLVNDINGRDCLVEVECEKNGQQILIRRGIKPNIFDIEIDGVPVDQSASSRDYQVWLEDTVLGFNLNSFQQVVSINGSSYTPFFLLSSGNRRKMVDDLLAITVFSKMYSIHLGTINSLKDRLNTTDKDIEKYEATIASLKKGIDELSNRDADIRQMVEAQIADFREQIEGLSEQKVLILDQINNTNFDAIALKKLQTKVTKIKDISRDLEKNLKSNNAFIQFMEENTTCPTCFSELTDEFREEHKCKRADKVAEIQDKQVELSKLADSTNATVDEMLETQSRLLALNQQVSQIDSKISQITTNIKFEEKKLDRAAQTSESSLKEDLIKQSALLEEARQTRTDLLIERQYLELQTAILKDSGIKSRIVNQMIPKMTKDINHYLNLLELDAKFEIDENFNETIYRRFKDPVTYTNLSAGERARVDIAVLFTWREIAKAKNSLSCNLLFLDEIFDNTLDEEGLDLFINLLRTGLPNTNVFLISHRPEVVDKFESNMRIEKRRNFSFIV